MLYRFLELYKNIRSVNIIFDKLLLIIHYKLFYKNWNLIYKNINIFLKLYNKLQNYILNQIVILSK